MTKQDAIDKLNQDHELFIGSLESWQIQHGDDWQNQLNAYVIMALEMRAKTNAKYGTIGKVIIPDFVKPYIQLR